MKGQGDYAVFMMIMMMLKELGQERGMAVLASVVATACVDHFDDGCKINRKRALAFYDKELRSLTKDSFALLEALEMANHVAESQQHATKQ
jgi:hypothetical protein